MYTHCLCGIKVYETVSVLSNNSGFLQNGAVGLSGCLQCLQAEIQSYVQDINMRLFELSVNKVRSAEYFETGTRQSKLTKYIHSLHIFLIVGHIAKLNSVLHSALDNAPWPQFPKPVPCYILPINHPPIYQHIFPLVLFVPHPHFPNKASIPSSNLSIIVFPNLVL